MDSFLTAGNCRTACEGRGIHDPTRTRSNKQ